MDSSSGSTSHLDKLCGADEVDGVVVVFLHAGADGEDVGVKDDVVGIKPNLVDQQIVCSGADLHLAI